MSVPMRDLCTSTPSIRFEEMTLSINACSRKTLSFCGDCRVNSSCFPRASAKSVKYHAARVGKAQSHHWEFSLISSLYHCRGRYLVHHAEGPCSIQSTGEFFEAPLE